MEPLSPGKGFIRDIIIRIMEILPVSHHEVMS